MTVFDDAINDLMAETDFIETVTYTPNLTGTGASVSVTFQFEPSENIRTGYGESVISEALVLIDRSSLLVDPVREDRITKGGKVYTVMDVEDLTADAFELRVIHSVAFERANDRFRRT